MVNETPSWTTERSWFLSPEIQEICKSITEEAFVTTDPTKVSYFQIPDWQFSQDKKSNWVWDRRAHFIYLACTWILNVAPHIKSWDSYHSLYLNPKNIEDVLLYEEILADIVLYQALIEWWSDRMLALANDYRSKLYPISCQNILLHPTGKYTIYDIEQLYEWTEYISKQKVIPLILKHILSILNIQDYNVDDLFEMDLIDSKFSNRITNRLACFLERYNDSKWKDLYREQIIYTGTDIEKQNIQKHYETFIWNMKTILDVFIDDPKCIQRYIVENKDFRKLRKTALENELERVTDDYKKYERMLNFKET